VELVILKRVKNNLKLKHFIIHAKRLDVKKNLVKEVQD
jgi:hypothetical protein